MPLTFQATDGYIVALQNGRMLAKTVPWWVEEGIVGEEWLDGEEWLTWDIRFLRGQPVKYGFTEIFNAGVQHLSRHSKDDLWERGLREGVTVAPVNTIEDLVKLDHLRARNYWLKAPLSNGREVEAPGLFARLTETPMSVRRWAPRLAFRLPACRRDSRATPVRVRPGRLRSR